MTSSSARSLARPASFDLPRRRGLARLAACLPLAVAAGLGLTVASFVTACDGADADPAADAGADAAAAADAAQAPADGGSGADGGGSADATPDATPDAAPGELASYPQASFCADATARGTRCQQPLDEGDCVSDYACALKIRPEAREPLARCLATRACDTSDDRCYADAAAPFASELGTYATDCLARRQACNGSFSDDFCGPEVALGGRPVIDAVAACLAKPCADLRACFLTAFAPVNCK